MEKVTTEHLQRKAIVYVRQSTQDQVRNNWESQRLQYALVDKAREMGFTDVEVIDEDLGRSGRSSFERTGFLRLVADVSMKRVGAVLSLEASRLARNNRDWHQLVDLCTLTATLVVDHDGIYDPRLLNDRLLLGLKGTISEFELGLIRQRALEAQRAMVKRGELYTTLPVGYIRTAGNRCEKDPDARVQYAIELVFNKFRECGSVRQTLLWFRDEGVLVPSVSQTEGVRRISWRLPVYNTILKFLKNPIYAGAYAYGRTVTRTTVINGRPVKVRNYSRPMEEWEALIKDHHEGYISWEEYERNQRQIQQNANMKGMTTRGPARRGRGLLAGLLRCKRCGRMLHVAYSGANGQVPRYSCRGAAVNHGEGYCISVSGLSIDRAVEKEILRVVEPEAVAAAIRAVEELGSVEDARRRSLALALEQAKYEADRAFRQYDLVDPGNRLVASELERRWNKALEEVRMVEKELLCVSPELPALTREQKDLLFSMAKNFRAVWYAPSTDIRLKKRLARTLIEEVIVDVSEEPRYLELVIRWSGGCHTALRVKRNSPGRHRHSTDRSVVDLVRDLARTSSDKDIARTLNRLGVKTARANSWTESRVRGLRTYYDIPPHQESNSLNMQQAAERLGISITPVKRLVKEGTIRAWQAAPYAPWVIEPDELERVEVKAAVDSIKRGRKSPLPVDPNQRKLDLAGM